VISTRTSWVRYAGCLSLAPGFSPVLIRPTTLSRFNGFSTMPEAAEAADVTGNHGVTGLKPGANEKRTPWSDDLENTL